MLNENSLKIILIVDDDPVMGKLVSEVLTKNGYQTHVASEAAEGLQMAINLELDLIILDVMMPIINGYNFCRLLKVQEGKQDVPVIFLTSRDAHEDAQIGREMGASAYMTKPVNTEVLLMKLEQLLAK